MAKGIKSDIKKVNNWVKLLEDGYSLSDIARMEGCSRENVRQILLRHNGVKISDVTVKIKTTQACVDAMILEIVNDCNKKLEEMWEKKRATETLCNAYKGNLKKARAEIKSLKAQLKRLKEKVGNE